MELDNVPPSGTDLMHELYKDKIHVSYERRVKADKIIDLMKDQLANGESMRRLNQEEQAMMKYIANKELYDTLNDERKKKMIKQREAETKRWLDIQLQERESKKYVKKYEDSTDAHYMTKDIQNFTEEEIRKSKEIKLKNLMQQTGLKHQIEDRKKPKQLDPIEY